MAGSSATAPQTAGSSDRLWGGGYGEATHPLVLRMNASVSFDRRMWHEDIVGSVAHATMLSECGLLGADDYAAILGGLRAIHADILAGQFAWSEAREDVHMNIEAALRDRIGAAAGRLHTARSRNDQVALDERLWLRRQLAAILERLAGLLEALGRSATEHHDWPMCGYTHLQRAQPVTVGHHLLAHATAFERDAARVVDCLQRQDVNPLGSGALAGTTLAIDRARTTELLGFARPSRNSLDAVGDRDHLAEALFCAALGSTHLSRVGEELVLFTSAEFGYVRLPDAFTTGSSLMPQKKNPDMAELLRAKSGRVLGDLVALLTVLKGLPLAYNKDLQEDKEPLFDGLSTWHDTLEVATPMLAAARWQKATLLGALDRGFLLATDLADALVNAGVPFRTAHEQVAALVAQLAEADKTFRTLGAKAIAQRLTLTEAQVKEVLDVRRSLRLRDVPGGPHPVRVRKEAEGLLERVAELRVQARRWAWPCPAERLLAG
ncbi:MAG: argininosuccinate lyase [Myxococcales bacterium]|nr:argininosuccinate lyase [Myxococcales bacterium]